MTNTMWILALLCLVGILAIGIARRRPKSGGYLGGNLFVPPPGKVMGLKPPLAARHPPPKFWDGTVWRAAP